MSVAESPARPASPASSPALPLGTQPYLTFSGRCEEALNFYRDAIGAQVTMIMRFKDAPAMEGGCGAPPPGDNVMHAAVRVGGSEFFATDGPQQTGPAFAGFAMSLPMPTEAAAERAFAALADGGTVQMPLAPMFFAKKFGMVRDRFGVVWMVLVPTPM